MSDSIKGRKWTAEERDQLANGDIRGAFADPENQKYPIAGPEDVADAWGLAGHADDPDKIRKRIIAIAKKYGWTDGLPETAIEWAEENNISIKSHASTESGVWKDSDGVWRWFGIWSNKFLDNDGYPEILSEQAHMKFEARIDLGLIPMPVLKLWHEPFDIGVAEFIGYDRRGFMVASGTFFKEYEFLAEGIAESDGWGMSHGMIPWSVARDKEEHNVITDYVSYEVSVLPLEYAANLLTSFSAKGVDDKNMDMPTHKRQELENRIGVDRMNLLDKILGSRAELAEEEAIPSKEVNEVEAVEEQEEAQVEAEVEETVEAEVEAEAEKEAEAEVVESAEVEDVKEFETNYVSRSEVEEAFGAVAELFKEVTQRLNDIDASLKAQQETVKDEVAKAQKEAEQKSLASMFGELAMFKSVEGAEEAYVDGRTSFAKDAPEETAPEGNLNPIEQSILSQFK